MVTNPSSTFFRIFAADMENVNKKLTPLKFLHDVQELPWGTVEYKLADLGFVDSMACEGWLKGNTLSDIMQTYLERVVGETSFDWYGTQFPVMVKRLSIKGRSSLHVNPDDEVAEQRYDSFGRTSLWYVEEAGSKAQLFLGFKKSVTADQFYRACQNGSVESMLHTVTPHPGEMYLLPPGLVHAAQDVTLIEVAESSELWFRLFDWERKDRELHLEEAFDLIDLRKASSGIRREGTVVTPQFTLQPLPLKEALKSTRDQDDTFLLYICIKGGAVVQADGANYQMKPGELVLVPAECNEFFLLPEASDTFLLEIRMDPRPDNDLVSEEVEE